MKWATFCLRQDQGLKALAEHTSTQNTCQCHSGYCLLCTWDFGSVGPLCCFFRQKTLFYTRCIQLVVFQNKNTCKNFVANLLCHNFWTTWNSTYSGKCFLWRFLDNYCKAMNAKISVSRVYYWYLFWNIFNWTCP